MQTAYGSTRLGAIVADCDTVAKPLKPVSMLLVILTAIVMLLLIVLFLYNKYKIIDTSKSQEQQEKEIKMKKTYISIGTYTTIVLSLLSFGSAFYMYPNVKKLITCQER